MANEIKEFIYQNESLIRECIDSSNICYLDVFYEQFRALLNPHYLEMVHCTKLLPHEMGSIKNNGLRILTTELVEWRINAAFERGYLNAQERDFLLADYQSKLKETDFQTRQNQLWLVTPKHLSSEMCGVARLFTSWGGESVYSGLDDKQTPIADKLKAIGIPCVVKAHVLISDLQYGNIENAMIHASEVVADLYYPPFNDTEGDIEGYVKKDIPAEFVKEIIDFHSPKFSELCHRELLDEL